jgi:hypothetical protein
MMADSKMMDCPDLKDANVTERERWEVKHD